MTWGETTWFWEPISQLFLCTLVPAHRHREDDTVILANEAVPGVVRTLSSHFRETEAQG